MLLTKLSQNGPRGADLESPGVAFHPEGCPVKLLCLGVSHQSASVRVREPFAVSESALGRKLAELMAFSAVEEALILSTCNRVEYYAAGRDEQALFDAVREFIARFVPTQKWERNAKMEAPVELEPDRLSQPFQPLALPKSFYVLEGEAVVSHLFRVVSGLESMVLGETEILGQVKKAYAAAMATGSAGRRLNKLFQRAFRVAKEVRTHTHITRGPVSVGSVAVDLAGRIFENLSACHVMILGAGETGELTARALLSRGVRSLFVANRTFERAATLAAEMGGEAIHFEESEARFAGIDILISSTAAPHPIVTRAKLAPVLKQRGGRPLFVIDLAVPRNVEAAVGELEGVVLYDIDSLESIARQSLEIRRAEVTRCEEMLARHVGEFSEWLHASGEAVWDATCVQCQKPFSVSADSEKLA